jgi:aerobic-type carbon monoxide dehydrogenase small subunit (CoxS/CutS family)
MSLKISRRGFVKLVAGGTAAAVGGVAAWLFGTRSGRAELESYTTSAQSTKTITLNVNGKDTSLSVKANATLLAVLRDDLKLMGTKPGCSNSECGACTVLLDGTPVYSCHRLAVEADGHTVTTIEGISSGGSLTALQQAFVDEGAFQCGFCTPGFIVTATALLASNPNPTDPEVRQALSGNLCRCGSYPHIVNAVLAAANGG